MIMESSFDRDQAKIMETLRISLQNADTFARTAKPYPRPNKDMASTILKYQMFEAQLKEKQAKEYQLKFNNLASVRHSSLVVNLDELKPIYLKQMYVNKVHKGKYLLCRTLTDPFYLTSMNVLICDETDEVENLSMYHCSPDYSIDPSLLLPKYSILLIKEPHLIGSINNPNEYYLRVESPTDLVILSDLDYKEEFNKYLVNKWVINDDPDLTYESLNAKGNKFFVDKNYHQAVRYYTRALNWCLKTKSGTNKELKKTLNNRSLANLRLERYYSAYEDALKSSEIVMEESDEANSNNEKSYFRMGKALYCMRQYADSAIWFTKCIELNPENKEACAELVRAKERIQESETGQFNTGKIIEDSKVRGQLRLDIADYVCPDIEVACLNDDPNYKGVVAKVDIKRNTLLVGAKAGSIAYEQECTKNQVLTVNMYTKKMDLPSQSQNMINIIHKAQHDPFLVKKMYKLYAGPNLDRNQPVSEFIVDTQRIEAILTFNSFKSESYDVTISDTVKNTNGFWLFPSYFNHSCLPNAKLFTFSDYMMIYTMRDIKKGEELTISYTGLASYKERSSIFHSFGFKCSCRLCDLDGRDDNLTARRSYIETHGKKLGTHLSSMIQRLKKPECKHADTFVEKVRGMYVDKRERSLQVDLIPALMIQAQFYFHAWDFAKAALIYLKLFEMMKDVDEHNALSYLFDAINAYNAGLVSKSEVKKLLVQARNYSLGDKDLFEFLCRYKLAEIEDLDSLLKQI